MNVTDAKIEKLERELHLKQLQTNGLLNITQAINNNLSSEDLYLMYRSILNWEMGVGTMALFVNEGENGWRCSTSIGLEEQCDPGDIIDFLLPFQRTRQLNNSDCFLKQFNYVIPVLHKELPIAYALVGSIESDGEDYHKLQFITTITNVIAVALENKRLFKRQIEQEKLSRDMQLAEKMQHMMVPDTLPNTSRYELASLYQPHFSVGGDYFDFYEKKNTLTICVADIAGKGMAAALLMANFQALFRTMVQKTNSLNQLVRELNSAVLNLTHGERHLTLFLACLNTSTGELEYVNAGHQPPILIVGRELKLLTEGCTILGFFDKLPELNTGRVSIDQPAMLVAFTDGLTDIKNEEGSFLSNEMLEYFALENAFLDAQLFNEKLLQFLARFKGENKYPDDLTVLTCKMK